MDVRDSALSAPACCHPQLTCLASCRIHNDYDTPTWERMSAIKSRVLRIWDGAPPAIKICCVKFAQRVVLAQTLAVNSDQKVSHKPPP